MARARKIAILAAAVVILSGTGSMGGTVIFELGYEFSGAFAPETDADHWLRATFTDRGSGAGAYVELLLEDTDLYDAEHVKQWYFNLDPDRDVTKLTVTELDGDAPSPYDILLETDAHKADGDGLYDILFDWMKDDDPPPDRFGVGESIKFKITSSESISANSFAFLSKPDGGNGPWLTAAHVGGIGPDDDDSGWVTVVPLPPAAWMGLALLGGLVLQRRFRRRR